MMSSRSSRSSSTVPRWRNRHTHMSQKHELPGSNPGWGTRFGSVVWLFPRRHGVRTNAVCSFTTWMWQVLRPRGQDAPRGRSGMVHVQTWLNRQSATLPASRRGFEARCLPRFLFPSSKGEDRGPSSRVCRFESGRERHRQRGRSSVARAPALQAGERRLESDRLHHFLAVAQRLARLVRDEEDAGSNPAGETNC